MAAGRPGRPKARAGTGLRDPGKIALVVRYGIVAVIAVLILRFAFTYRRVRVPADNDQMSPVLEPGSRALVHVGFTRAEDFRPGDIVVYSARRGTQEGGGVVARFGRVAGTPGCRVEVRPGAGPGAYPEVWVDGRMACYSPEVATPLEEGPRGEEASAQAVALTVPEGTLYVMNDRRGSKLADSRRFGPVSEGAFVGKVVIMPW